MEVLDIRTTTDTRIIAALAYAAHAHNGQVRKYSGDPYIVHPVDVFEIVSTVTRDIPTLQAALLHDVVEDTDATVADIADDFCVETAEIVEGLSDVSVLADGNRAARKAKDRAHSAAACAKTQTVKYADLTDNTKSILEHDRNFAVVYLGEKELLLDVMLKGDAALYKRACKSLADAWDELDTYPIPEDLM